jgi:hypothetical protein
VLAQIDVALSVLAPETDLAVAKSELADVDTGATAGSEDVDLGVAVARDDAAKTQGVHHKDPNAGKKQHELDDAVEAMETQLGSKKAKTKKKKRKHRDEFDDLFSSLT